MSSRIAYALPVIVALALLAANAVRHTWHIEDLVPLRFDTYRYGWPLDFMSQRIPPNPAGPATAVLTDEDYDGEDAEADEWLVPPLEFVDFKQPLRLESGRNLMLDILCAVVLLGTSVVVSRRLAKGGGKWSLRNLFVMQICAIAALAFHYRRNFGVRDIGLRNVLWMTLSAGFAVAIYLVLEGLIAWLVALRQRVLKRRALRQRRS